MPVKYGKFELPTNIKVDEKSETHARFIAEPFERGFGHTVGNALRRIMLTSMEAPAIISVKMEGIPHEYMAAEGIVEDVTHIVLALKGALLTKDHKEGESGSRGLKVIKNTLEITPQMIEQGGGKHVVTLKEFLGDTEFDIVNPDHKIFTATQPQTREIITKVGTGRGYVPSERHHLPNQVNDEILVDSIFTPVRLVNYFVENTRVGQDTDFDKLILDVDTDGRVKPEDALSYAVQIAIHHMKVFETLQFQEVTFEDEEEENDADRSAFFEKLAQKINEIELSVRSTNCLQQANIETIAELVIMPESEMLKFRNFGKKSLNEIKAKLEEMNLYLGMDLKRYGITRENVREVIETFNMERQEEQ